MTATMTTSRSLGFEPEDDVDLPVGPPRRRWAAGLAIVGGLTLLAASAGAALASRPAPTPRAPGAVATVPGDAATPLPNIGTASETYEPGHASGWHVHPGVHSVTVLRGTLTIYDEHCGRTEYGPGETYLGGNAPHLARNEGAADLDVAITYVYTSTTPGTPVAAPAGCDVR